MLQSAPARRTRADGNRRSIGADGPGGRTAGHGTGPLGVLTGTRQDATGGAAHGSRFPCNINNRSL